MSPASEQAPVAARRTAYLVTAAVVVAVWCLDAALVGHWPLETLYVRLVWGLSLVAAALLVHHRSGSIGDLVGSISGVASSAAMAIIAGLTGGSESLYFPMLPFLPVLISQAEPERPVPLFASAATGLFAGLAILGLEGRSPLALAGWTLTSLFLAWWAAMWFRRAVAQREAELESHRREAELERERAQAVEERARALGELAVAQQQRGTAERLAAVGRLAANVAHEINNPLAYVKANLESLQAEAANDEFAREALSDSLTGIARIEQIVSDLRSSARAPLEGLERVDAADVIAEAARLASMRLRHLGTLTRDVATDLPHLHCQRGRLVQVLINLLANAADALENRRDGHVVIGAMPDGETLLLWVEDDGPGLPPGSADRLFEPFFTTKAAGAGVGIGLAICREFAEAMGGSIRASDSPLGGARFELRLPLGCPAQATA